MTRKELQKHRLPDKPGVYFFLKGGSVLYIGKATSLRDRTKSYFSKDLIATRGPIIVDMVFKADGMKWEETDSVLEALILEANLIKKHQPYYNTKEKDDKSFNYVCITKEALPMVLVKRGKELKNVLNSVSNKYGPFTSGPQLREAMKIIRRIFPFIDAQSAKRDNAEFYRQLGLSPDVSDSAAQKAYAKNIRHLKLFFEGKKKRIILDLKKDMMQAAKQHAFERAGEIKRQIFALEHINDVALLKRDYSSDYAVSERGAFRIEAYDIAHMSGKNMVGVMTVLVNGEPAKNDYRKFIIRTQSGSNDTGALEEVLRRRLKHTEWHMPDLIVLDGSLAQENVGKRVLAEYKVSIPLVTVVKDERHKACAIRGDEKVVRAYKQAILLANVEAHRFAIAFHKEKRSRSFLPTKR